MAITDTIKGLFTSSPLPKYQSTLKKINDLEESFKALSDADFPAKTIEFKKMLAAEGSAKKTLDDILPEAFALVREASRRMLGQRHYDVQLLGSMVLHSGNIAEMRTGEGKTLVATLSTYLNALEGKGVHVVTVNDYLARRDAAWMGQIHNFLGLTVGIINSQNISYLYDPAHKDAEDDKERDTLGSFKVEYEFLKPCSRKEAYAADVTYGTNNEYGFDYLRDNLAQKREDLVQRGHHYAVVDEIDSILIDESRTPLIIAGKAGDSENLYGTFAKIARQLARDTDYTVDEKHRAVQLTDAGITRAESLLGIQNIYTEKGIKYVHHLETAVRAEALFSKDKEYVVKDNAIIIVDTFTGRLQPGRRWNEGLHQAIEAKEGVKIEQETRAVASITYQNYFRFYKKLSGMTGTAKTSEEEFLKVYGLSVIQVPTHRVPQRIDHTDLIFQTEKGKIQAMVRKIKELNQKGQPVLIGTASIEKNELLHEYLTASGVPHEVLNAKNHEREGEIIAQAGRKAAVTIATNMAGRGVDIILGGVPYVESAHTEVKSLGGLYVIGTERHEARRIDNQLRGRSGRQGDPGETQFYLSFEDDLMRVFATESLKNMMGRFGIPEDEPVVNRFVSRAIENAQAKIEGINFDSRKHTLDYDMVLNTQRESIYSRRRKMLVASDEEVMAYGKETFGNDENVWKTIEEKREKVGDVAFADVFRRIVLYVTDSLWTDHIETMDYMRSSVNLRAYGQREPIVEYKKEGLRMFKEMEATFYNNVVTLIGTIEKSGENSNGGQSAGNNNTVEVEGGVPANSLSEGDNPYKNQKIGRNDACPCGSGKKYKQCHGK
ncbi:MAG: preprotein translocase subunit SecA [Candidatus Pacebacteria bacterium]|nr:preprotein translocase subunit SecA [Candidatus Paceibacterota bacterium]MBP9851799.1 preprotein translocase subunit SecA [Candidatus Paceibacterota bacterium]